MGKQRGGHRRIRMSVPFAICLAGHPNLFHFTSFCFTDVGVLVGGTQMHLFVLRKWLVWVQKRHVQSPQASRKPCLPPARSWPEAPAGWRHKEGPVLVGVRSPAAAASRRAGEVRLAQRGPSVGWTRPRRGGQSALLPRSMQTPRKKPPRRNMQSNVGPTTWAPWPSRVDT